MRTTYVACVPCGLVLGKAVFGDSTKLKAFVLQCPQCGMQTGEISGEVAKHLLKTRKKENRERVDKLIDMAVAGATDQEMDKWIDDQLKGEQMTDETANIDPT